MLVEGDFTVVVAHVDFKLARGTFALPTVIGIPNAEVTFGGDKADPRDGMNLTQRKPKSSPPRWANTAIPPCEGSKTPMIVITTRIPTTYLALIEKGSGKRNIS